MLIDANKYKRQIYKELLKLSNKEKFFYFGSDEIQLPEINEDNKNKGVYRFGIVDSDKLIGYFSYYIDLKNLSVSSFGLVSFDKKNKIIGLDVYKEIKRIIKKYSLHSIQWNMVGDNPAERHYDKYIKKFNGIKYVFPEAIRTKDGKFHDDVLYYAVVGGNEVIPSN